MLPKRETKLLRGRYCVGAQRYRRDRQDDSIHIDHPAGHRNCRSINPGEEVKPMYPMRHFGPEGWKTVRAAIRGWGPTLRFLSIIVTVPAVTAITVLVVRQ